MNNERKPPTQVASIVFAVVAGQAGCLTLGIILLALFAGIWLDNHFHLKGPFTIGLLVASVPISLFFMVRIAMGAISNIKPPAPKTNSQSKNSTYKEEEDF